MKKTLLFIMVMALLISCTSNAQDDLVGYWKSTKKSFFTSEYSVIEITDTSYIEDLKKPVNVVFSQGNSENTFIMSFENIPVGTIYLIDKNTFQENEKTSSQFKRITKDEYNKHIELLQTIRKPYVIPDEELKRISSLSAIELYNEKKLLLEKKVTTTLEKKEKSALDDEITKNLAKKLTTEIKALDERIKASKDAEEVQKLKVEKKNLQKIRFLIF